MFLVTVVWNLGKHSEACALCKKNRGVKSTTSLAVVVPTSSSGSGSEKQSETEEEKHRKQIYRQDVLDKLVPNNSSKTRKLSTTGLAFVEKAVATDQAHRTQLRHTQSRAMVALQIDKKKDKASQRLNNRLLSRQKSKKIEKVTERVQQNLTQSANLQIVDTEPKNKQKLIRSYDDFSNQFFQ